MHARVHARWLSIVHRRWLHAVWTEHRLALYMQDTTTNECGANCAVNRHPPSPPKGGGKKSRGGNSSRSSKKPAEDVPTRNLCPVIPVIGHGTVCAHGDKYAVCVLRACLVWGPVVHGRTGGFTYLLFMWAA